METSALLGTPLADEDPLKLVDQLARGLPASALDRFKRSAKLADAEVAALLQVGSRTLSRLKATKSPLSPDISDRLYAVAAVYALAEEVLGDAAGAQAWLAEPQHGLAARRPQDLLGTELGRQQVTALLKRIEHGFLA